MFLFSGGFILGEDPAGVDLINPNAIVLHQGVPQIARQGGKCSLGGGVGKKGGLSAVCIDTANVHDASFIRLQIG